jgi:hypothetical protein
LDCTDDLVTLSPTTPWSPPREFCERLSKKYGVKVYILYSEGGCNFSGTDEYHNGEHINEECYEYLEGLYHLDNECFWSEVDSELDNLEDITEEEFINKFPFVDELDKKQLREDYRECKIEN